jgi:hypothetical protein
MIKLLSLHYEMHSDFLCSISSRFEFWLLSNHLEHTTSVVTYNEIKVSIEKFITSPLVLEITCNTASMLNQLEYKIVYDYSFVDHN